MATAALTPGSGQWVMINESQPYTSTVCITVSWRRCQPCATFLTTRPLLLSILLPSLAFSLPRGEGSVSVLAVQLAINSLHLLRAVAISDRVISDVERRHHLHLIIIPHR